jgi:serine/threonine-protein kinase
MQPPISTGTILQSRYRLLNLLGQGGFGRTYLVEDQGRFNELCALKELNPPQGDYAFGKSKELFQREAQILHQIEHPQIPKFRATFEEDHRLFLVQDFVEGKTYREILDNRRTRGFVFAEKEVVDLMQKILPILTYLHGKGIIHRDIAPDNIMLRDRDQLPVLIDFGVVKDIATRLQTPETLKQSTTVGKLGYAPIEQMQTGNAYPNSDLYALAVTAIVLLTGREPQELLDDNTMTWHWQRWCQVSPGFAQVINRMLSYTPAQRFSSATDVSGSLANLAQPGQSGIPQTIAPSDLASMPSKAAVGSQMATVAIGRDYEPEDNRDLAPRPSGKRSPAAIPERNTLWDDPWAVGLIAVGLISLVGISTYLVTSALRAKPPVTETTPPVVTEPTLTPKPSVKPTPKPIAPPISFEQKLELTAGKPLTRSGNLKSNQTANLTFSGKQGQTLDAAVNGEGVLMTIFSPEGQPINDRAKRASSWNGALPLTGEYNIQLKTVKKLDSSDYQLDLDLKDPPKPSPEPTITSSPVIPGEPIGGGNPIRNERVLFDPGKTSTQISNSIKFPEVIRYLVLAKAGQTLDVSVQGATLSVLGSDGKPFPDATDRSNWRALLPTNGDYIIEVNAKSPFILNVEVK